MTTYTPNYQLPLYEGSDKPDLADQYADAMQLLDAALAAAQAARTELQNSVATLNTNLAATNTNVETALSNAALAKTDAANAVSLSQAATNTANAASAAVAAMQTDVTNNKTLVEEHVNYFADLEITDEASAQDVNTKINNAVQGTMSNTQAITALNGDLGTLRQSLADETDFEVSSPLNFDIAQTDISAYATVAMNKAKTILKVWGQIYISAEKEVTLKPIPGYPGDTRYGTQLPYDTGLRPSTARLITHTAIDWRTSPITTSQTYTPTLVIGTDGYIYTLTSTLQAITLNSGRYLLFLQIPIFLAPGDWPTTEDNH